MSAEGAVFTPKRCPEEFRRMTFELVAACGHRPLGRCEGISDPNRSAGENRN